MSDGDQESEPATVSVVVDSVNDVPVALDAEFRYTRRKIIIFNFERIGC